MKRKLVDAAETKCSTASSKKPADVKDPSNEKAQCPSYGSQNYWDERYKNNYNTEDENEKKSVVSKKSLSARTTDQEGDREEGSPGFSWYFTYNELKPLLLPLLLGRDEEEEEWSDCDMGEMEEILEGSDTNSENSNKDDESNNDDIKSDDEDEDEDKDKGPEEEHASTNGADEKEDSGNLQSKNSHPGEEENADDDDSDIGNDNEEGLNDDDMYAKKYIDPSHPPKKFLEIGCGDAPVGAALCKDILHLQEIAKLDARHVVDQIICFDYSPKCIDILVTQQQQQDADSTSVLVEKKGQQQRDNSKDKLRVQYKVHDARDLPYEDKEFHVVMDKGTLDAMLSDKAEGKKNCIKIISEAARVLAVDGYILIVSHLNANGPEGMSWVNEVVVKGLKDGDSTGCDWRIEVHGNDADNEDEDDVEVEVEGGGILKEQDVTEAHYGPAVYIIRKMPGSSSASNANKEEELSRVDLKFFGY